MNEEDYSIRVIAGYRQPKVKSHNANDDETLQQLSKNDPDIAGLYVNLDEDNMNAIQMEIIGRAISKSDYLRDLTIYGGSESGLQLFFRCLADNRSLEQVTMQRGVVPSYLDHFALLAPFFENNSNLRCIRIKNWITIPTLLSTTLSLKPKQIVQIDLYNNNITDTVMANFITELNRMPGLNNLLDLYLGNNEIRNKGSAALGALLKNSECRIISLDISDNFLDDECMIILISGLTENDGTVKSLSIGGQRLLTSAGWNTFSTYLSSPHCSLEKIILERIVGTDDATSLGNSMVVNSTVKYLDFGYNHNITPAGWRSLFSGLSDPTCTLLELNLDDCNIDDEVAIDIFSALANNTSLKKLILIFAHEITSTGWVACFEELADSRSALEEVNFGCNEMDDEVALALVVLVSMHMSTITSLKVWGNSSVTGYGWSAFATVLHPGSTSTLQEMRLGDDMNDTIESQYIDDDVITEFIAALQGNTSLRLLDFGAIDNRLHSLDDLVKVLCDVSSVDSVCQSNHTLLDFAFTWFGDDLNYPSELDSLLQLNEITDKTEVIRRKLLLYFFSDVKNIGRVFGSMPTTILPDAVEWIGRDRLGYSVMFDLCRSVSSMLNLN